MATAAAAAPTTPAGVSPRVRGAQRETEHPMQSLRREWLHLAVLRLQHPAPHDAVASITSVCGYPGPLKLRRNLSRP